MRRLRERYEQYGFDGLLDRRRCRPSEKRVAQAVVGRVLELYRDRYFDCNVRISARGWRTSTALG